MKLEKKRETNYFTRTRHCFFSPREKMDSERDKVSQKEKFKRGGLNFGEGRKGLQILLRGGLGMCVSHARIPVLSTAGPWACMNIAHREEMKMPIYGHVF